MALKSQRYAIEGTYLTNVPRGERTPPDGQPWEGVLFCWRIKRYAPSSRKRRGFSQYHRFLVSLKGSSKRDLAEQVSEWVKRYKARIVSDETASKYRARMFRD